MYTCTVYSYKYTGVCDVQVGQVHMQNVLYEVYYSLNSMPLLKLDITLNINTIKLVCIIPALNFN